MTFNIKYENQTNIVVADGDVSADTPKAFQAFLDTKPFDGFRFEIHLNSNGGSLLGGMQLGRMIRQQGLIADIAQYDPPQPGGDWFGAISHPGSCYSACALAFLGGKTRQISEGSKIGFHQFHSTVEVNGTEAMAVAQGIAGVVLTYITEMGASPSLFTRMSEKRPEELFIPSDLELREYAIVTSGASGGFTLEPYRNGVIASAGSAENVEGDNLVYSVATFCRHGVPFLLLSGGTQFAGLDQRFIDDATREGDGLSVWSGTGQLSYPQAAVRFRKGRQLAEIKVDGRFLTLLKTGKVEGAVQYPHALGGLMHFAINATPEDLQKVASSFKLCIN
ncbi:hypothetical protein [Labrys miyagiensis]